MTSTMNQVLIALIPKTNKDPLLTENWRPILLLNVYKSLALTFAVCIKSALNGKA